MGIFSRLGDIINANINSLLEKAEDPEKIIRLMIQEMEDTLVEVRSAAAKAIADKKERVRHRDFLEREQLDWEHKAELALRKEREDLAKAALMEKSRIGDQIDVLNQELKLIDGQLERFNDDISKLQSKITDAKNRQRALVMRHQSAHSQLKVRSQLHDRNIDDVLQRFERAEQTIDRVEGEAEAYDLGRRKGLAEEIEDLEADERIDEELSALKQRLDGKDSKAGKKTTKKSPTSKRK